MGIISHLNAILSVSRNKISEIFMLQIKCLLKCPYFQEPHPALKNSWLRACDRD